MDPNTPRSLTPESFKAVAKAVEDITGSTSLPPAVKAENERHKMDLSARTDWFMGFLVFLLILFGRIPVEPYFWAMVALGSPSAVASMLHLLGLRRSAGASMTALVATGATKIGLSSLLKGVIIGGSSILFIGCFGEAPPAVARARVNKVAKGVSATLPLVEELCVQLPERCDDAQAAYEGTAKAVALAQNAIDLWLLAEERAPEAIRAIDNALAAWEGLQDALR
jgi:hypothetical protein